MKKKFWRTVLAATLTLTMAAFSVAGCGSSGGSDKGSGDAKNSKGEVKVEDLKIAYVPTTMNNPFWTAMMGGIEDKMSELGMDADSQLVTVDSDSDQATMNNYIYDLINQNVDAIIMAPMDTTACTEALQACADADIPVINVDTAVDRDDLVVSVIASDNYEAGVQCAEDMMKKLDKGSKIYVLNQPSGSACVQREKGFMDTIGDYFDVIGTSDTSGDTAKSLSVAEDAITGDSKLAGFFCINDMAALGCVQACAAAGRDDIVIYGVDGNPDFMGYVKDGSATGSAAQQPSVVGADALQAAVDYLSGKEVKHEIVVPVQLITADNISKFDISDWQ